MKYTRIYADAKGESHFEDVEMGMKAAPYNTGAISKMFAAKGVMFRVSPDYFVDWHNAPRRQFVVNITGSLEVTASDGNRRSFGPGTWKGGGPVTPAAEVAANSWPAAMACAFRTTMPRASLNGEPACR
jgi:quercetin dioxygenase-like cupin family protein